MVDYYDSIAEGYDELHGEEQERKFNLALKHVQIEQDAFVLDVGCGSGLSSKYVNGRIVGCDPALKLLLLAKPRLFQISLCRSEHLPFKSGSFDHVIAMTSVHNFNNINLSLSEIERVAINSVIISVLKRSQKYRLIETELNKIFNEWSQVNLDEDELDNIYILNRNLD